MLEKEGISIYIINYRSRALSRCFLVDNPTTNVRLYSPIRTGRLIKVIEQVSIVSEVGEPVKEWAGVMTVNLKDWGRFATTEKQYKISDHPSFN